VARSQALAISYSVAMILYLAALLALLRRALGGLGGREIAGSVARVAAAAAAAGAAAWSGRVLLDGWFKAYGPQGTNTLLGLVEIGVCTALAGAVYILLVRRLRVPEAEYVYRHLSARFPGRFRSGVSAEAGTTG